MDVEVSQPAPADVNNNVTIEGLNDLEQYPPVALIDVVPTGLVASPARKQLRSKSGTRQATIPGKRLAPESPVMSAAERVKQNKRSKIKNQNSQPTEKSAPPNRPRGSSVPANDMSHFDEQGEMTNG